MLLIPTPRKSVRKMYRGFRIYQLKSGQWSIPKLHTYADTLEQARVVIDRYRPDAGTVCPPD